MRVQRKSPKGSGLTRNDQDYAKCRLVWECDGLPRGYVYTIMGQFAGRVNSFYLEFQILG